MKIFFLGGGECCARFLILLLLNFLNCWNFKFIKYMYETKYILILVYIIPFNFSSSVHSCSVEELLCESITGILICVTVPLLQVKEDTSSIFLSCVTAFANVRFCSTGIFVRFASTHRVVVIRNKRRRMDRWNDKCLILVGFWRRTWNIFLGVKSIWKGRRGPPKFTPKPPTS